MSSDQFCNPEVAGAIAYEFRMFEHLCDMLKSWFEESGGFIPGEIVLVGTGDPDEQHRYLSALLESMLLHARVLLDFFYYSFKTNGDKKYDDDVISQDFVPEWDRLRPAMGEYLAKHKDRLNKALAHLTTTRVKYNAGEKRWDVVAIRRELQPVVDCFKSNLSPDRRPWFGD